MIDIITYVPDSKALITELQEKFPDLVSQPDPEIGEGGDKFIATKTPTVKNKSGESITLMRVDSEMLAVLEALSSLVILGTYEDIFATPKLLTIYDSVYDRTPKTFLDEESIERTYTPPEKFGVFA